MPAARNKADATQPVDPSFYDGEDTSTGYFAIIPSDTVDFAQPVRKIYVGTSAPGNISIVRIDGTAVLFKNVPQGATLLVAARRVNSSLTTASDLVGLP